MVKQNVLTPWFLIIIGEEEWGNNFEEDEALPPGVMQPEDMTDQEVAGLSDDELLPHVHNVDQMLRDVEFLGMYTSSELSRLKQFVEDSKKPLYPSCCWRPLFHIMTINFSGIIELYTMFHSYFI